MDRRRILESAAFVLLLTALWIVVAAYTDAGPSEEKGAVISGRSQTIDRRHAAGSPGSLVTSAGRARRGTPATSS